MPIYSPLLMLPQERFPFLVPVPPRLKPPVPPRKPGVIVEGEIIQVLDGDTVLFRRDDTGLVSTIRLFGIDAPEAAHLEKPAQPFAENSQIFLANMIEGKKVKVELTGEKTYGRDVGIIFKDGVNVNLHAVSKGWAWAEPKYLSKSEGAVYLAQQKVAETVQPRGLWLLPKIESPKDFRARTGLAEEERVKNLKVTGEIVIPAWNDIIHIARPLTFTSRELEYMQGIRTQVDVFGRSIEYSADFFGLSYNETSELLDLARDEKLRVKRAQDKIRTMMRSPTPALAKNVGVIMTALDDIQDFTTTVGVISRTLGRVLPAFNELAIASFTIGEAMNRFNLINRLSGGEVSQLCRLLREATNASHKATIFADVDKRMKRLFPSKGELCEIAQTTDMLFGVGISLGPLVGLAEDLLFGRFTDAPIRFKDWTMSQAEYESIITVGHTLDISDAGFGFALGEELAPVDTTKYKVLSTGVPPPKYSAAEILSKPLPPQADLRLALAEGMNLNESAAILAASGYNLPGDDYLRSLVAFIDSALAVRKTEVKNAIIDLWHIITFHDPETKAEARRRGFTPEEMERLWGASPPKKTKIETRLLMQSLGIDPYGQSDWPIPGLGASATIQEIQHHFEIQANLSLQYWRKKFGVSDEGLFLDACVKEIGTHASVMFCAEDGVIHESLEPYTLIYIKSLEANLSPPPNTSDEKFTEWMLYIKQQIDYYDIPVPTLRILQDAYNRFFKM